MPIHCQYYANPRSIFLWIFANPCQSMPILANPMPISGQSVTSYVLNHRTSPLCGMVPSLLGGWNPFHHAIPIPAQYRPILCQAWANPLQIQCKYGMVPSPFGGTKPSHPVATQCKLDTNPAPLLGTIQNQSGHSMPFNAKTSISLRLDWHSWSQSED